MLKYGKRKASLLPSFSSNRDSTATSRSRTNPSKKRGSTASESVRRLEISNPISLTNDNSIDEMASMLLDDSTTILDASKRIAVKHVAATEDKDLPQLPELMFNGDGAFAQRTAPVATAAGRINEIQFLEDSVVTGPSSSQMFGHSADQSTPPIPRRSSKRNSSRPKNAISNEANGKGDSCKSQPVSTVSIDPSTGEKYPHQAAMINAKIAGMQAAMKALKPDGELLHGPLVPIKKRRIKDNKVISKVRAVISERINARSVRKRRDSIRDDHLLDRSVNELHDDDDLSMSVSNMDIRLNEGQNFNKSKVFQMTGHGNIPRKPVADDGRSIRSRKSNNTDPFIADRPGSSGITRAPTNFEISLQDDMSIDLSAEIIPDLPASRPRSSRESLLRGKKLKSSPLSKDYGSGNFDVLLTSSPLAQSTPRIRLEPKFEEDGRRTLKNVPADTRSLFDPESSSIMDVDSTPAKDQAGASIGGQIKRKSSLLKESALGFRYHSKRAKKHPSPSKAELEGMEKVLQQHLPFGISETLVLVDAVETQYETSTDVGSPFPAPILAPKDPNPKVKGPAKPMEKRRGFGIFAKSELSRSGASLPDIPRKGKAPKSLIPKPADTINSKPRQDNRFSLRDEVFDGTAMDIDELQWNKPEFGIQKRKA